MATVLSGNLSHVDVLSIVKLLVAGDRTGRILLERGDQRENGEIYLANKRIVHAVCDTYLGEPAFHELILWTSGKFSFEPDVASLQKSIDKETGKLITEATLEYEAWQKIARHIPSFRVKFRKTDNEPSPTIRLKAKDWELLHLLEKDEYSVDELSSRLGMKDMDVAGIVYMLAEAGLITAVSGATASADKQNVSSAFFKNLENELIQLIGPVASIIIDDVVETFGEDQKTFPKDKVPPLVEAIANEIYDPAKQLAFKQLMLKQIRTL
ncbi:MAG TPA: DUF4388 domain-containing protein [bacterium]|nr:DUF4388 domain-containing protein [bacterium]HNC49922.1 DUF4388 domain-containing protein [bacterium]HNE83787.1 DUF4388 domain-containing protein [bacterium]HNH30666.1 DUF4388 domain-containing protein [bacterium]HNH31682.1 DUF4388 domain-containing protein [bacterium]